MSEHIWESCRWAHRCEHACAAAHLDVHAGVSLHMPLHIWECVGVCTPERTHLDVCTHSCTHRCAHLLQMWAHIHMHVSHIPGRASAHLGAHLAALCMPCVSPPTCHRACGSPHRSRGVVAFCHWGGAVPHAGAHPASAQVSGTTPAVPCCPLACHSPCPLLQEPPGRHLQGADGDGAPADPARRAARAGGAVAHHQCECPLPWHQECPLPHHQRQCPLPWHRECPFPHHQHECPSPMSL